MPDRGRYLDPKVIEQPEDGEQPAELALRQVGEVVRLRRDDQRDLGAGRAVSCSVAAAPALACSSRGGAGADDPGTMAVCAASAAGAVPAGASRSLTASAACAVPAGLLAP